MKKSLFEQMGGTYTQVGDYLLPNLRLPEQQGQTIGVWGQRHARYLKQHHKIIYMNLLTSGKLNDYLVDIENQAENMFFQIVKQLAESDNIRFLQYQQVLHFVLVQLNQKTTLFLQALVSTTEALQFVYPEEVD